MKCPHCRVEYHANADLIRLGTDIDGALDACVRSCPACRRLNLVIARGEATFPPNLTRHTILRLVHPKQASRLPAPHEVADKEVAEDYNEACLVLADSPKASAALSRRCLQHILQLKAKATHHNLADAIQHILDNNVLPSHIAMPLDAVRNIGNFAAHPMKSKQSGEILPVEPGEAELNLDVIEALFDFYYVQPTIMSKKLAALNQKLQSAGKPPVKQPSP